MSTLAERSKRYQWAVWGGAQFSTLIVAALSAIELKLCIDRWRNSSPSDVCILVRTQQGSLSLALTVTAVAWCIVAVGLIGRYGPKRSINGISFLKFLTLITVGPAILHLYWSMAVKPWRDPLCLIDIGGSFDSAFHKSILSGASLRWIAFVLTEFAVASIRPHRQPRTYSETHS
ncbi:MAG: hypothetical protein JNK05_39460 [Myxococcales bacterium]|nr:hypothetical protein [Myxococcales bacterium]